MVVLIAEKLTASLRGELTRWMIQLKAGVYVGRLSARVRDLLWEKVCENRRGGAAILVHSANNEQGFAIRTTGRTSRIVEDYEGLFLAKTRPSP